MFQTFKKWWRIVSFQEDVNINETPDLKKDILSLILIVFLIGIIFNSLSFISLGVLPVILSILGFVITFLLEIILAGFFIYLIFRIFGKKVLPERFFSPYFRLNIAIWGVLVYILIFMVLLVLVIVLVSGLFFLITKSPSLIGSLMSFMINFANFLTVLVLFVFLLIVLIIALKIRLAKDVYKVDIGGCILAVLVSEGLAILFISVLQGLIF